MDEDNLMLADVEQAILTGEILECQKDKTTAEPGFRDIPLMAILSR